MDFKLAKIKKEIIIDGFNAIYFFEFGKDFNHLPEVHDFWEMVYVDSGEINAISDGIIIKLIQGQAIFHRPMEPHSHISNKKTPNNMVVVSFTSKSSVIEFFNKKIFSFGKSSKVILSLFIAECKNALQELPNDFENKSPLDFKNATFGSVQLMECYFIELLFSLIRSNEVSITKLRERLPSNTFSDNSFIDSVVKYLEQNIYTKLSLQDICDRFLISKAYMCQVFKDAMGYSLIDYFINLKIAEAKRLIRTNEYNITQISHMLGYSSIHHFSRAFKKVTGFSPMTYKKSIK